ncbi:MAG: hypothetical protein QNJ92_16585 [Alphaproteobacteria bacterium]|nr:hypothetical protein [Alphaproteobacteria bacterium]
MSRLKESNLKRQERRSRAMALGDLARHGVGVFCWCNRCAHQARVPIEPLIAELGAGFAVPELGARMRCSGCGSKDVATRPDWPSLGRVARHGAEEEPGGAPG